jgi:putative transposase
MSRPLRLEHPGAAWHITVRGNERRAIFRSDADRRLYLTLLASAAKRFRWSIRSFVLMTNHVHLVLVTPEPTLSRGMHWLNGTYARLFNLRHHRVGHLFQGRFKAILIDEQTYLHEVLRYTVLNPVRAGMVENPAEYRWSSYRALAGLEKVPEWLDAGWLFQLDPDPTRCQAIYRDFIAEKLASRDSIWEEVVGQIYLARASGSRGCKCSSKRSRAATSFLARRGRSDA